MVEAGGADASAPATDGKLKQFARIEPRADPEDKLPGRGGQLRGYVELSAEPLEGRRQERFSRIERRMGGAKNLDRHPEAVDFFPAAGAAEQVTLDPVADLLRELGIQVIARQRSHVRAVHHSSTSSSLRSSSRSAFRAR